jgi:hypothetical protein
LTNPGINIRTAASTGLRFAPPVKLGIRAKGRAVIKGTQGYQFGEEAARYSALFKAKKDDIALKNGYLWDIND